MKRPQQLSWTMLVTLLLVISLFVPGEASTPCLASPSADAPARQLAPATCGDITIEGAGWGACNDINCCGGPPEAECKPAAP